MSELLTPGASRWAWLRTWRGRIVLAAVIAILFSAGWFFVTAKSVASELRAAQGSVQFSSARDAAVVINGVREARERIDVAHARVHDPVWTVAAHLPFVGRTPAAVRAATDSLSDLLHSIEPDESALVQISTGESAALSPATLRTLTTAAAHVKPALRRANSDLKKLKLSGVPTAVATPVGLLRDRVSDLDRNFDSYESLLKVAPILLGMEKPRDWLLLLQNGAEARTTGGLIGATGVLHAERGVLKLTRVEPNNVLDARPIPGVQAVVKNDLLAEFYGSDLTRFLDMNQSPNFAVTAGLALAAEKRAHGITADGVFAMDQHTLKALLGVTGPVDVEGTRVSSTNVVSYVTRDVYDLFKTLPLAAAVKEKDRRLLILVRSVFSRVSTGRVTAWQLASALTQASADGRLTLWSSNKREQAKITASLLGGGNAGSRPRIIVGVVNASGNKLDAYVQAHVRYSQGDCQGNLPRREARVEVTLTNSAPTSGLPSYVAGRLDLDEPNPKRQGSTLEMLYVHVPRGSQFVSASFAGKQLQPIGEASESKRKVWRFYVESKAGSKQTLNIRYLESTLEQEGAPRVWRQPMALPMTTEVVAAPLCPVF